MKSKRSKAREYAAQLMYSSEIMQDDSNIIVKNFWLGIECNDTDIIDFANDLYIKSLENIDANDDVLKQFLNQNWSFERIGLVEKSILRVAINELFNYDTPVYAIMNDYVLLAKTFSDEKSAGFVNGVLDSIRKKFEIERGKNDAKRKNKD